VFLQMQVFLDDREDPLLGDVLRRVAGFEVSVRRLTVGDFLLEGRLVVERKTLLDFAQSLVNDRLFLQAERLVAWAGGHALVPAFLLEGTANDLRESAISREALQGAIVTLGIVMRIAILRSGNMEETAKILGFAARQAMAPASQLAYPRGRRPKRKRRKQLHILQSLPGIGPKKAEALLDHFGTIEKVINADQADLANHPAIGLNTAQKIQNVLHAPEEPYQFTPRPSN